MCLVCGIADGRCLNGSDLISDEQAVTRRGMLEKSLAAAAGVLAVGGLAGSPAAQAQSGPPAPPASPPPAGDRVLFLGVNGGPVITPLHYLPSIDLIVNGQQYLIDCGGDTARQMVNAKLGFGNLHHLFLTHHHFDHVGGYPELLASSWVHRDPIKKLRVWGPPPVDRMHRSMLKMFRASIEMFEFPFPPFAPLFGVKQLELPKRGITKVMENGNVVVHSTRVNHGPRVAHAYAYRFDIKRTGKSVVFSGDTTGPNAQLVKLAQDADLLVHEVLMSSEIPGIVAGVDPKVRKSFTELLAKSHTDVADVPRVAKLANAKRVAMCHYGPSYVPLPAFKAAAQASANAIGYGGEILTPTDLESIAL